MNNFGLSLSSSSSSEIIYSQGTETLSNIKISSLAELIRAKDKNSLRFMKKASKCIIITNVFSIRISRRGIEMAKKALQKALD